MPETPVFSAAAVAAPHTLAAEAGRAVLAEGGNAIEAMVAMAATIAVVYPHMNAIGGDGFWLVREPGGRVRGDRGLRPRRAPRDDQALSRQGLRRDPGARAGRGLDGRRRGRRLAGRARLRAGRSAAGCRSPRSSRDADPLCPRGLPGLALGSAPASRTSPRRCTPRRASPRPSSSRARPPRPARSASCRRSPTRSRISPAPGSTISTAATSGARSPPTSRRSAAR